MQSLRWVAPTLLGGPQIDVRYALIMIGTRTEACKITIQAHELIGSLTPCEDAQKGSENKAFIQVFHPIQSVKSTNRVMLRYTRAKSSQARQRWRS